MNVYVFDLKFLCGNYAYFSTFTVTGKPGKNGREFRQPTPITINKIQSYLQLLQKRNMMITNIRELKLWLYLKGWAIIPENVANALMPQWLKSKECIKSPLGMFTDIQIVSPTALKRYGRGVQRNFILERDKKSCLICGTPKRLTMQQVIPSSMDEDKNSRNWITICEDCHQDLGETYLPSLYDLVEAHHGYDPSLNNTPVIDLNVINMAQYLANNLMQSRCEVW
jgi:hypothetical protein